jgi:hypothetical protein
VQLLLLLQQAGYSLLHRWCLASLRRFQPCWCAAPVLLLLLLQADSCAVAPLVVLAIPYWFEQYIHRVHLYSLDVRCFFVLLLLLLLLLLLRGPLGVPGWGLAESLNRQRRKTRSSCVCRVLTPIGDHLRSPWLPRCRMRRPRFGCRAMAQV